MTGPYGENEGFTPYEPGNDPGADAPAPAPPAAPTTAPATPVPGRRARGPVLVGGLATLGVAAVAVLVVRGAGGETGAASDPTLFANDLVAGQCLIGAGFDPNTDDPVSDMEAVDCATAHDAEVLQVNVLDRAEAEDYDIDDDHQVEQHCRQFLDDDQLRLLRDDQYFLLGLTESEHPVTGDHVACLLVRSDGGPLHGALG